MGFDVLQEDTTASDRRVAIDLAALKEVLDDEACNARVRWLPGPQHIADSWRKAPGNGVLMEVMAGNGWSLKETAEVRAERERVRDQRRLAAKKRELEAAGATTSRAGLKGEVVQRRTRVHTNLRHACCNRWLNSRQSRPAPA